MHLQLMHMYCTLVQIREYFFRHNSQVHSDVAVLDRFFEDLVFGSPNNPKPMDESVEIAARQVSTFSKRLQVFAVSYGPSAEYSKGVVCSKQLTQCTFSTFRVTGEWCKSTW